MKLLSKRTIKETIKRYEIVKNINLVEIDHNKRVTRRLVHKNKNLWPILLNDKFHAFIKNKSPFLVKDNKDVLDEFKVDLKKIDLETINKDNIFLFYFNGHVLFDVNERPLTRPYYGDYLAGNFDNEHYHLEVLLKHLKKSKFVTNGRQLKILDIPYYNQDDNKTQYIAPIIKVDQKMYERFYAESRRRKDEFWSCRLSDMILLPAFTIKLKYDDYLGIRKFLK